MYYLFLKNCVTSEGAVSHNLYQQLSIARYQVIFYANNFVLIVITNSVQCLRYMILEGVFVWMINWRETLIIGNVNSQYP